MARPHKQMPGTSYQIIYHGNASATVNCTYHCPYCMEEATSSFEAGPEAFEILERGCFFEPLHCDYCGKVTDVRFMRSNKTD